MYVCIHLSLYIYIYIYIDRWGKKALAGWQYLSNATCLIRPHSFSTALLVQYGQLNLLHYSPLLKNKCVRQVVLDKWFPPSSGSSFKTLKYNYIYIYKHNIYIYIYACMCVYTYIYIYIYVSETAFSGCPWAFAVLLFSPILDNHRAKHLGRFLGSRQDAGRWLIRSGS